MGVAGPQLNRERTNRPDLSGFSSEMFPPSAAGTTKRQVLGMMKPGTVYNSKASLSPIFSHLLSLPGYAGGNSGWRTGERDHMFLTRDHQEIFHDTMWAKESPRTVSTQLAPKGLGVLRWGVSLGV